MSLGTRTASLLTMALVACTPAGGEVPARPTPLAQEEAIAVGMAVLEVQGHLLSARELAHAHDLDQAAIHANHPRVELVPQLLRAIPATDANMQALTAALDDLTTSESPGDEAWIASDKKVHLVLDDLLTAAAGEARDDPAYQAQVMARVLNAVAAEYRESVSGGKIADETEYQDAYGFFKTVHEWFDSGAPRLAANPAAEAALHALEAAFPSVRPPAEAKAPTRVDGLVARARQALAEAAGITLSEQPDAEPDPEADPEADPER